jgi:hypothetical protein
MTDRRRFDRLLAWRTQFDEAWILPEDLAYLMTVEELCYADVPPRLRPALTVFRRLRTDARRAACAAFVQRGVDRERRRQRP